MDFLMMGRVWSDIRSEAEIQTNYQRELAGNEDNLVAYWKLNNNYLDETTNDNDLTASGSPVFSDNVPFADKTTTSTSTSHLLPPPPLLQQPPQAHPQPPQAHPQPHIYLYEYQ
jgi:hypothetical protein